MFQHILCAFQTALTFVFSSLPALRTKWLFRWFIGGALAGSLAVATDAAHLLTDFAGFMISLFALYISERPATKRLSYGYHRAGKVCQVHMKWALKYGNIIHWHHTISHKVEPDFNVLLYISWYKFYELSIPCQIDSIKINGMKIFVYSSKKTL